MSELVNLSITHQCGDIVVIETWEVPPSMVRDIRTLYGEPYARTEVPTTVVQNNPHSIQGGEWTTWRDDADGVQ